MKTATTASIKDFQKEVEEVADELNDQMEGIDFDGPELDTINKERERVFDHFWTLEEQQTILGLLKAKKMKKGNKTT